MSQMILTADLASRFESLSGQVELCDPTGRVIGRFVPQSTFPGPEWEPISPEITDEELARREKLDEPRYTTEQVLAHLRSL